MATVNLRRFRGLGQWDGEKRQLRDVLDDLDRALNGALSIGSALGLSSGSGIAPRLDLQAPSATDEQGIISGPGGFGALAFGGALGLGTALVENIAIADEGAWTYVATGAASYIWMGGGWVGIGTEPSGTAGSAVTGGDVFGIGQDQAAYFPQADTSAKAVKFGASADANLYRGGPNNLTTDDSLTAGGIYMETYGNLFAQSGNAAQVALGTKGPSAQAGMTFGSAEDTNLYRSAANTLKTDDTFAAAGSVFSGDVVAVNQNDNTPSGGAGKIFFGSAWDTNLYRNAANELKTDDAFTAVGAVKAGSDVETARYLRIGSIANPTVNMDKGIVIANTAGGAPDTPTGGVFLYAEGGALKAKGSAGTVTTIANA